MLNRMYINTFYKHLTNNEINRICFLKFYNQIINRIILPFYWLKSLLMQYS